MVVGVWCGSAVNNDVVKCSSSVVGAGDVCGDDRLCLVMVDRVE